MRSNLLAWPEPDAYLKVRSRNNQLTVIDAQLGTPQTAMAVIRQMQIGQVTAFDFHYEIDLLRFRTYLYQQRGPNGWTRRYITRAHGRWVMIMRVE